MMVVLVDEEIQESYMDTCGQFQLCFYKNLFYPDENSKILNDKHLTNKTLEMPLNKIFSTKKIENEHKVTEFAEEYNISKN